MSHHYYCDTINDRSSRGRTEQGAAAVSSRVRVSSASGYYGSNSIKATKIA